MKDPRYLTTKVLIESGEIKSFSELLTYLPSTVLAADMKAAPNRLKTMIEQDPGSLKLGEVIKIAELFGVDSDKLLLMAARDVKRKR